MPGFLGPWEIVIVVAVVLLIFGPKKLPQVGRSLGRGMRELKDAVAIKDDTLSGLNPFSDGEKEKKKAEEKPRSKVDQLLGLGAPESEERDERDHL